jgi:hypothetical protein
MDTGVTSLAESRLRLPLQPDLAPRVLPSFVRSPRGRAVVAVSLLISENAAVRASVPILVPSRVVALA